MKNSLTYGIPLKYSLPLLIFGFAIASVVFSYFNAQSSVLENKERDTTIEVVTNLMHLQGVIQLLLRSNKSDEAKSVVSSYGSQLQKKMLFFTDPQGRILSSTRVETIGRNWKEINEPVDPVRVARVLRTRRHQVHLSQNQEKVYGYADICVPADPATIKPINCGFLYYSKDLYRQKQAALAAIRDQALQQALWMGTLSMLLWLVLHFSITRRISQINSVASRFGQGDWESRNQLSGNDEIAKIGATLNSMYGAIANEHNESLRAQAKIKAIIETAVDGIITIDTSGIMRSINPAVERIFGYQKEQLIGQNVKMLMPVNYASEHNGYLTNYLTTGEKNIIGIGREAQGLRSDGTIFPLDLSVSEIVEHDEPNFVGIIRDISDRKNAENEIKELRDRLAHVGRVSTLGEMAAGIAHEINQPLTAIASYTEACQRLLRNGKADSSELLNAMERTSAQAHRAGQVIRRMRSFVKERSTKREELDMNELIDDLVKFAKMDLPIQGASIRLDLTPGLPKIIADSFQIQQVLLNLIRNAADAMQDVHKGKIIVIQTVLSSPSHIRISVTDQGFGISDKYAKKIFTPFFSTKESGMGIGLAICRSVVESHHGELNFKNNPDGGTTFNLTLPTELRN